MKENIPTPARAGQLGDGKGDKKLRHKAAAPIPGLGCNYIARTTVAFNGPGPSEFRPRRRVSVFMCWPALVIPILVGSSSTDLGDLTLAGMSCQIEYRSASLPSPRFAFSHEKHQRVARCKRTHSSFDIDLRPSGKDQPHTCAIHFAIGTSVFIILTIQRCSNISFGVGRVSGLWVRLKRNFRRRPTHNASPSQRRGAGFGNSRFFDEILHPTAPLHLLLIFQSRRLCVRACVTNNDVGQEVAGYN